MPEWRVEHGDCRDVLAALPTDSIDSALGDPPYGLGFMGASWDKFGERAGEKAAFKAFMGEVAAATFRVMKPGAHVLMFGGTRTYHWLVDAWEDAGFEVRDQVLWLYGQGFPKSQNISKTIDKSAGVQPIARRPATLGMANNPDWNELKTQLVMPPPTTPEAIKWAGWGTALKPSVEPLVLLRKPIRGPIYRNVLKHGTGGLNIDGCRVGTNKRAPASPRQSTDHIFGKYGGQSTAMSGFDTNIGRWPANVILDPEAGAMLDQSVVGVVHGAGSRRGGGLGTAANTSLFRGEGRPSASNGTRHGDKDGASRFFYCAKPSRAEKEAGLDDSFNLVTSAELTGRKEGSAGLVMVTPNGGPRANPYAGTSGAVPRRNTHSTVKPIALLRYLARLITPPGGTVLDPFAGSGSAGIAVGLEGFNYIGVELDSEGKGYVDIARARIRHHVGESTGVVATEADPMFRGFA